MRSSTAKVLCWRCHLDVQVEVSRMKLLGRVETRGLGAKQRWGFVGTEVDLESAPSGRPRRHRVGETEAWNLGPST